MAVRLMDIHIEDYLTLNRAVLDRLSSARRIQVLGELARRSGQWLAHARADAIDELRIMYGSENAVAKELGISRNALIGMGDGPVIDHHGLKIRPALLRRGLELAIEHAQPGMNSCDLMQALVVLKRPGRPNGNLLIAAARRIVRGVRGDLGQLRSEISYDEWRTFARAVAHASDITTDSRPDKGYTREWDIGETGETGEDDSADEDE